MYRIIKVLNNNGILVYHNETGRELILLGNGVGFGKRPTQQIEQIQRREGIHPGYADRRSSLRLKMVNGIRPEFIEAAGRIIEEAEKAFPRIEPRHPPPWRITSRWRQSGRRKTGRCQIRLRRISGSCLQKEFAVAQKGPATLSER